MVPVKICQNHIPNSTCCSRVESNDGRDMCTMPGPFESTSHWLHRVHQTTHGDIRAQQAYGINGIHVEAYSSMLKHTFERIKMHQKHIILGRLAGFPCADFSISGAHRQGTVHVELFPGGFAAKTQLRVAPCAPRNHQNHQNHQKTHAS